MLTRRAFFLRSLAAAGACLTGFALYEPHELEITQMDVVLRRLPPAWDGLRVAQLSDLHLHPYTTANEIKAAANAVNALHPDLVVLTGDFVSEELFGKPGSTAHNSATCARLLSGIWAPFGMYAVLGNHDVGADPTQVAGNLQDHGITVLRNRAIALEKNGAALWIAGIDDAYYGLADIGRAVSAVRDGAPVLMLAHEPDVADEMVRHGVDLQLSGHSHGGQLTCPLLGPPYLPRLGRKYWRGLYRIGELQLYTNRGIGTIALPLRFGAPPEITLFTLRSPRVTV